MSALSAYGRPALRKFGRRLSDRIFMAAMALATLIIVAIGGASFYLTRANIQENIVTSLNHESAVLAEYVGGRLGTLNSVMSNLLKNKLVLSALVDSYGREIYLEPMLHDFSIIDGVPVRITITDFQGVPVAGTGGTEHPQGLSSHVRQAIARGQPHAEIIGDDSGASLRVAMPLIFPRTHTVEGAVVYESSLLDLLPSNARRTGPHRAIRLLHRDPSSDTARAITIRRMTHDQNGPCHTIVATKRLPVSDVLAPLDLTVEVSESDDELHAALGRLSLLYLVLAAISLIAIASLSFLAGRYLTGPLRELQMAASNVAKNRFLKHRVSIKGADEIAQLGVAFNAMLERIEDAHDELQSRAQYLRAIMDNVDDGIITMDKEGRIDSFNTAAERIFGYSTEEIIGRDIKIVIPEFGRRLRDHYLSKRIRHDQPKITDDLPREFTGIRKDATTIPLSMSIGEMFQDSKRVYIVSLRDISARKHNEEKRAELESALRQAQKMEALGTLAGGTAHEFNNLLVPIMGLTELTMHELSRDSQAFANLAKVARSADRAAKLVDKILSFSHKDEPSRSSIDLARVVNAAIELLRPTLPATIEIKAEADDEDCFVLADESQIHQVLINLAANAADAMEGQVGELVISYETARFDHGFVGRFARLDSGCYAKLSVQDNGHGMNEETMVRIFEPFFTTKEVGKGTGLGLAMIHGIVAAHGGGIEVESEPGHGTRFTIYLPICKEEPAMLMAG